MGIDSPKRPGQLKAIAAALEGIAMGIAVTRSSGRLDYANAWLARRLGLTAAELVGLDLAQFRAGETVRLRMDIRRAVLVGDTWQGEIELAAAQGITHPLIESVFPLHDEAKRVAAVIHFFHDVGALRHAGKLARSALRDPLTRLPNGNLFANVIDARIAMAERSSGGLAVLYLDIDELQSVNARLGRDAGDELLRQIARRIEHTVRESDTIARIGGDEFAVLLGEAASAELADVAAQKLLRACTGWYEHAGDRHAVTFSAGLAIYPRDGHSAAPLVYGAAAAMYAAKAARRKAHAGTAPTTGSKYAIGGTPQHS